jgi:hypothetical protein
MLYEQRTWTCRVSDNAKDEVWDLAFLTKAEYIEKYKITEEEYQTLASGEAK